MIVTARQLEDLHRLNGANGQITLPYRARLTPLALDWVRAKKVALGYSDVEKPANGHAATVAKEGDACCTGCAGNCFSFSYNELLFGFRALYIDLINTLIYSTLKTRCNSCAGMPALHDVVLKISSVKPFDLNSLRCQSS